MLPSLPRVPDGAEVEVGIFVTALSEPRTGELFAFGVQVCPLCASSQVDPSKPTRQRAPPAPTPPPLLLDRRCS